MSEKKSPIVGSLSHGKYTINYCGLLVNKMLHNTTKCLLFPD